MTIPQIRIFGFLTASLLIFLAVRVFAETYRTSDAPPVDFSAIQLEVEENIPNALLTAQCGGWDRDRSVGQTPGSGSVISDVRGVPGRSGRPLQEDGTPWPSGMAWRIEDGGTKNDGLYFPETAEGRVTSCRPEGGTVERRVWHDPDDGGPGTYATEEADTPAFDELPCRAPGNDDPDDRDESTCKGFCRRLNDVTYEDCKIFCSIPDGGFRCAEGGRAQKFTCSEEWTTAPYAPEIAGECPGYSSSSSSSNDEPSNDALPPEDPENTDTGGEQALHPLMHRSNFVAQLWTDEPASEGETHGNCVVCMGEECRCPMPGGCAGSAAREERTDEMPTPGREQKTLLSFYRSYAAVTKRDAVQGSTKAGEDVLADVRAPVACYGFYREFDPKRTPVEDGDARCVIDFPYTRETLREKQSVVGQIGPQPALSDSEPLEPEIADGEVWRPLAGGMSFASEDVLKENGGDLTSLFLDPDVKTVQAIEQRLPQDPLAWDSFPRATDDTVTNETGDARLLTFWVHRLQQDIARLLTPPTVRLRIPASWVPNSQTDSVSENSVDEQSASKSGLPKYDPYASVDVQLQTADDIPGTVLAIAGKYFTLQKETLPAVIPLGSPREFAARKRQWESYKQRREALTLFVPPEVDELIARFGEYENQIEKYRILRVQATEAASALLGRHEEDATGLVAWVEENTIRYRAFLEERMERHMIAPLAYAVQKELTTFSDDVNLPWCRVDLLTTPIYSLLRKWYPGAPGDLPSLSCGISDDTLPLLCIPHERDYVFDLTRFSLKTTPLRIPVLQPVQVQLDLDRYLPPAPGGDLPDFTMLKKLPELPPVPTLDPLFFAQLAGIEIQSSPKLIDIPKLMSLEGPRDALLRSIQILQDRNAVYKEFWDSLEPPDNEDADPLACPEPGRGRCVHIEMDLRERMERATAEPLLVGEQLAIQGLHRGKVQDSPENAVDLQSAIPDDPKDDVWAPPLHTEARPTPTGWQIVPSSGDADSADTVFDELRRSLRRNTIDDDGGPAKDSNDISVPYRLSPTELYRSFSVPKRIELAIPPKKK